MQQVVVIHGGETFRTPEDCLEYLKNAPLALEDFQRKGWKSNLPLALGADFAVFSPRMPNSSNARYAEWKLWFEKVIALMKDGVILVGHSLGGTFLAKYLSENRCPKRIRAVFLVAPCYDEADGREYLGSFLPPRDKQGLIEQGGTLFIYHSEDDDIVPYSNLADFRRDLPSATIRTFIDRGHFLGEDFPELVADIKVLG